MVSEVVTCEIDMMEVCTFSNVSTELVISGNVVECTDGLLKMEGVAKSVELIVIVEVSPIGFRLD